MPRFDIPACFAALLGAPEHGRWLISPDRASRVTLRYLGKTLILETVFRTAKGTVALVDFMFSRDGDSNIVRFVRGLQGQISMRMEPIVPFDYGSVVPWVSRLGDGRLQLVAGPDRLLLDAGVSTYGEDFRTLSDFTVAAGQEVAFSLSWSPSFQDSPPAFSATDALKKAESFWSRWAGTFVPCGGSDDAVLRSLLTLKALAHRRTGGIVAAATTSLPERLGGSRNWDYRYCWLRDATFTLLALKGSGYLDEAKAWHQWLSRAVAGSPDDLQTVYGVAGERRLDEYEVSWLPGYQGATPVRVGNAAVRQLQLDVYGEVLDAFYVARQAGLAAIDKTWPRSRFSPRDHLAAAGPGHLGGPW